MNWPLRANNRFRQLQIRNNRQEIHSDIHRYEDIHSDSGGECLKLKEYSYNNALYGKNTPK